MNLSGCTNLQSIGTDAFQFCSSLQTVDLSNCSQLQTIASWAFGYCSVLSKVSLTNCTALQTIDSYAFSVCNTLSDFDFSKLTALSNIGNQAFSGTALFGEIKFASTINQLGAAAFNDCDQITSVNLTNSAIAVVSANTFSDCAMLEKVDFTGCTYLNTLNKNAFNNCPALKEVVIDNGFYTSEAGVLYVVGKTTLMLYPAGKADATFTIPSTVSIIQSSSFPYNKNLKTLTIPKSVNSIQSNAFIGPKSSGTSPNYTVIMESETPIGLSSDIGLSSAIIYVPKGALNAYKEAAIWKDYTLIEIGAEGTKIDLETAGSLGAKLTELGVTLNTIQELTITGPMNASDFEVIKQMTLLTKVNLSGATMEGNMLPNYAFSGLSYLKEVKLPNSITEIGENAFRELSNLTIVNLPVSLERVQQQAFYKCSNIENLNFSSLSSLYYIGWNAFNGVNIVDLEGLSQTSIREISLGAFANCPIQGSLIFPATLTYIGERAFNVASITSIKLKSPEKVSLADASVFESVDKLSCEVYVPKGLGATYKADTYWSPFGDNIKEYGHLVTVTTNNSAYGTVSGGGAFEEGETVTLTAKCGDAQWNGWSKYVNLFAGWYEGDNKVSDELTYQSAINTDKDYLAKFERINFEWDFRADAPDVFARMENVQSTTNSVTVNVIEDSPEVIMFAGWYENGRLISADRQITIMTNGNNDSRTIKALMVNAHSNVDGLINDDNKVDGQNVRVWYNARLTIQGDNTWRPNKFMFDRNASMLVESTVEAQSVNMYWERYSSNWQFISFPYDLKVSDIQMDGYQFVVREYDGDARASKGMGESWKQLSASDVMQANKGYILRSNGTPSSSSETYNSSIDDMNKLFNRQAVTIALPKHASNVPADANWNLVGNPFPCYFSVEQLFTDGLDGTVTVWSDDIQNYEYYTQDDAGAYLAPLTAFFIQHGGNTSSVTFNPEGRAATLPTTRAAVADLRSDAGREVINLLLANDSLSDKTRVVFNEAASTDYELGKDAAKFSSMNNNAPSLYTLDAQNQQLAINERPVGNGVVRLGCYIGVKGSYTLSAKEALASDLYLYDTETGASCNLRETSYTFTAEAGACNNRFELRTSLKGTGIAAIEGFSWQVTGNQLLLNGLPTGATVSLFDANGRMLFTGDAATATQGIALPQSGIYYLTIRTAEGVLSTVSIKR